MWNGISFALAPPGRPFTVRASPSTRAACHMNVISRSAGSAVSMVNPVPVVVAILHGMKSSELAVTIGIDGNAPDPNGIVTAVPVFTITAYPAWSSLMMSAPETVRFPPIETSPIISAIPSIVTLPRTMREFCTSKLLRFSIEPVETRADRSSSFPLIISTPSISSGP